MPATQPDNVYGYRAPTDILDEDDDTFFSPDGDQRPGPSGSHAENLGVSFDMSQTDVTAKIAWERGAKLINLFLNKPATKPSGQASGKLPDVHNIQEWHYRDLMHFPEAAQKEWKTAMLEELESLQKQNVFELTKLSKGRKSIGCRWVFNIKIDSQKKARLVTQGFSQVEGIDFNKLFSPVVRFESVRIVLALAALHGWYMTGVDVHMACLYGKLDEEIHMRQPEGFIARGQESKVICLHRALYGLKQAGLAWWKELSQSMKALGFKRLNSDARIFVCREGPNLILAVVYVDDAIFMGKNKNLFNKKKALFMAKWECRDLGDLKEFLWMHVTGKGLRSKQIRPST